MPITIAATSRLKSKKKIALLFESGKRLSVGPLQLRYLAVDKNEASQFGFSVPKKNHALAVHRNKIKRLLRESLRTKEVANINKGSLFMFIYLGTSIPDFDKLDQLMDELLIKLSNELS
jgi:ribonuclease P protein component